MTGPAAAQAAERRATVVVSFDSRSVAYGATSRDLNAHILDCAQGCRGGSGWEMCPTGERMLDALLRAYVSQEDGS